MGYGDDRESWSRLVVAAQSGDLMAWSRLIDRFGDMAVASAVGLSGDFDAASHRGVRCVHPSHEHTRPKRHRKQVAARSPTESSCPLLSSASSAELANYRL